ncbi:MAG: cupin domain-containing protein [Desulfobacteraceae bacterium]|nr:cupin domain-containing protein [Desulfobacteraceae bacterium]
MNQNFIMSNYEKHPTNEGVYLKHFFSSEIDNRLNNLEVRIEPGGGISNHTHDESNEFFYVAKGKGEFLVDGQWEIVREGEALVAPKAIEHGFKNNTNETLVLFSTFSPPIR